MSKTERALTSDEAGDALDEMFDDDEFADALDEALSDIDADGDDRADDDATQEHDAHDGDDDDDLVDDVDDLDVDDLDVDDLEDDDLDEDLDLDLDDVVQVVPTHAEIDTTGGIRRPVTDATVRSRDVDEDVDDDDDGVADEILEELRRAEIDGPVVAFAPQDESASLRRRPKRAGDYDPAPVPIPAKVPRVLGRRPRVRKVTRVVRHVDPWSVFKIALMAHIVLYIILLTASVLLWNVAYATGTVENVERFLESFGWNSFEFNGGELYHAGWIAGLFMVVGFTGLAVLAATLFNLITDLVGGVRFTVLEEEVIETRTSPMRRFVVRRAEPSVPAVVNDGFGSIIREAAVDDTGANARPTR